MKIKELLDGYYAGTLTDAQEEQLEMLMISGHTDIPEEERRLYLGITNLPTAAKPVRKTKIIALRITSVAATVALIIGLGYYIYNEQQKQMVTQQEILELALGNVGKALHQTDTTREQFASIISVINADTTHTNEINSEDI